MNGNVCSYPIVFRQTCNSRKNQIIGQWWRRVGNELLQARSLKRPLPGAPDVSSPLVSSLQFYLCWTLANFFYLTTHFPHPQPILCIKLLRIEKGRVDKVLGILPAGSISQVWMCILIWPPLTEWYFHPIFRRRFVLMSSTLSEAVEWKKKKQKTPPSQKIIYVGANQIFLRLLYCRFSQWWADVNFFWYTEKKSIMFSPSWCHLRLLFLLYF